MESWLTGMIGLAVVAFSASLLFLHWREWSQLRRHSGERLATTESENRYRQRRLRRRVQTSTLVGIVGAGMIAAVIMRRLGVAPIWIVSAWSAILFLLLWICLLAAADIIETQRHYGRLRHETAVEEAKFLAKLRRSHAAGPPMASTESSQSGNGKPAKG
ncbi:MAG: hypothetical protein NZ899_11385 [Thermoguttaceae bacterium]|nr:hypothetical protein [Thermoguttaceae bacterium]MDW8077795.1 hypothetical protein [Thermoguttaceae bacterium]